MKLIKLLAAAFIALPAFVHAESVVIDGKTYQMDRLTERHRPWRQVPAPTVSRNTSQRQYGHR
ncbi:MAG: hypothetical protein K2K77_08755 [Duncaniella sp.]|nr:hypothetical protein [Duncaniella sp.]